MARVPENERWEIVELYFKGRSQRKIAEAAGRTLKTVNRIVRAFKSCRRIKDAPRKPRSQVTTAQEDAWIDAAAAVKPGTSQSSYIESSKSGRSTVSVWGMITKTVSDLLCTSPELILYSNTTVRLCTLRRKSKPYIASSTSPF
ncbi:hypothetical protein HPB52_000781 [Rhipicephalus sanguineus]|uniref:Tick transposon n=1 Tax=Rhipicephalus sanguineus TaxID=34632 RepID=A0A9D4PY41_RHISA|nr:hypothetical protein HPB52_000781 [Rhipicephalus sanguineus]